tara:strand:- start:296 stop:535 length:240 start_codon:yes stop_codon:yes gene_type:complete
MWKLYRWNGHYIQGDLISEHRSEDAAVKKAKKEIDFLFAEKVNRENEVVIWLDGQQHEPMGVIIKKIKGAKRIRQGKEK